MVPRLSGRHYTTVSRIGKSYRSTEGTSSEGGFRHRTIRAMAAILAFLQRDCDRANNDRSSGTGLDCRRPLQGRPDHHRRKFDCIVRLRQYQLAQPSQCLPRGPHLRVEFHSSRLEHQRNIRTGPVETLAATAWSRMGCEPRSWGVVPRAVGVRRRQRPKSR